MWSCLNITLLIEPSRVKSSIWFSNSTRASIEQRSSSLDLVDEPWSVLKISSMNRTCNSSSKSQTTFIVNFGDIHTNATIQSHKFYEMTYMPFLIKPKWTARITNNSSWLGLINRIYFYLKLDLFTEINESSSSIIESNPFEISSYSFHLTAHHPNISREFSQSFQLVLLKFLYGLWLPSSI